MVGRGEVLVVGRDPARLAVAGRVLDKWAATPPESVMMSYDTAAAELTAIKKAIAASDWGALGASAAALNACLSSHQRRLVQWTQR